MQDQGLIALYQNTVKVYSLKRSNNGGRINKRTERWSDVPDSDRAGTAVRRSWTPTTHLLEHFATWCKLFFKSGFSKQRHNLIMNLELNMQIVGGGKRTPSPPFPAVFTHESMDCQVWVCRTDICYLYTCLYIWSSSDFPLDTLFECLWGKHQGFLEWLGFLKFCLFLYLFYMNWKFCQTHFDCMENMFHSQKTVKKNRKL